MKANKCYYFLKMCLLFDMFHAMLFMLSLIVKWFVVQFGTTNFDRKWICTNVLQLFYQQDLFTHDFYNSKFLKCFCFKMRRLIFPWNCFQGFITKYIIMFYEQVLNLSFFHLLWLFSRVKEWVAGVNWVWGAISNVSQIFPHAHLHENIGILSPASTIHRLDPSFLLIQIYT